MTKWHVGSVIETYLSQVFTLQEGDRLRDVLEDIATFNEQNKDLVFLRYEHTTMTAHFHAPTDVVARLVALYGSGNSVPREVEKRVRSLIHCATNATMTLRPISSKALKEALQAIQAGYFQVDSADSRRDISGAVTFLKPRAKVTLSEKGKAYILSLEVSNKYAGESGFFPMAKDIQKAQDRIRAMSKSG